LSNGILHTSLLIIGEFPYKSLGFKEALSDWPKPQN
jgi:hypothetical protein